MHGQTYQNNPCGSFGEISTFSFYPNKHITTGEGGMIVTDDDSIAEKCRSLKNLCFNTKQRFSHDDLGWNFRMTNLQAALGLAQLENLQKTINRKMVLGSKYQELLIKTSALQTPVQEREGYKNHYWVFGVILKPEIKLKAIQVMEKLKIMGIGTRPFFWPMHKQPILKEYINEKMPVAEEISETGFYLPSGVGTTDEEIEISSNKLLGILN
jgi:perosamine synthetase